MQASHGNTPMSLLLTVVTNMLGVVTVPYLLKFLVGTSSVRQEKLTST
jgi:predicted Na+-dependent transporter